jgi:hypothetical protein
VAPFLLDETLEDPHMFDELKTLRDSREKLSLLIAELTALAFTLNRAKNFDTHDKVSSTIVILSKALDDIETRIRFLE